MKSGNILRVFLALALLGAFTGCSDTWSGLKKDTGDNMEATGKAIEDTGEKVKK